MDTTEQLPDHVGLDFGNHSVKAVALDNISEKNPKLVSFGSQPTPHGIINSEDETHKKKLADVVKALFSTSNIRNKKVVIAIPEIAVFTRFFEIVGVKDDELLDAVYYQAKQYIPLPIDEIQMSFMKIGFDETRNAQKILLVAAPKRLVEVYTKVVEMSGLDLIAVETESVAIGRAMYHSSNEKTLLMLDFGSQSTDMSVMSDGNLVFSQSISIGSDAITQAIINKFSFEYNQAEEYKRTYGIQPNVLEGKVYEAVKPVIDSVMVEIQRGIEFYKSNTLLSVPSKCYIAGDGALLPGLSEYMGSNLGLQVVVADPWANISVDKKSLEIIGKNKPSYANAVGLALKLFG